MANITAFYLGLDVPEWGGLGATPEIDDLFVPTAEDYEEHTVNHTQPNTEFNRKLALNGTPFEDVREAAARIAIHTLLEDGGTFNPVTGDSLDLKVGYAVGGYQETTTYRVGQEGLTDAIAAHIQRMPSTLSGAKHYALGTWVEWDAGSGGTVYIDSVKWIIGRAHALNEGRKNHEKAIYDFESGESIYL